MSRHQSERGSGTVVTVGIIAILLTLLTTVLVLAHISLVKARATTAADLAALAAADAARGLMPEAPCTLAQKVADAHEVELVSCTTADGGVATVQTAGTVKFGGTWKITAVSRAGAPPTS